MLTLLFGTDWKANRDAVLNLIADDVANQRKRRILLVPELISHDTERRLCQVAGDSCSRFAEVVSFSRLTKRICDWAHCGMQECLDNGGRLVAMASAAKQLHSQLKAYAAMETNPEFLKDLIDAVDEFKRCCIKPQDLLAASKQTEGAFSQKLEELSLLLDAYDGICSRGKRDPRDQLSWGLEQLLECDFAQNHVFYIDGFPDFTQQNLAVITHLIAVSPNVVISINCDKPSSKQLAFEKAGETAKVLLRIAKQAGIPVELKEIQGENTALSCVAMKLFQGKIHSQPQLENKLMVLSAGSPYEECVLAADHILHLVQSGARYRDIAVVCPDLSGYANPLHMQLQLCGIPDYLAGTEDILEKSAMITVLSAIDAALSGYDSRDMRRYLYSAFSPLDIETCDLIENYTLLWGIQGKKWLVPWEGHPQGLEQHWSCKDTAVLQKLNEARVKVITPLCSLSAAFMHSDNLDQQICAVLQFLDDIGLQQRLAVLVETFDAAGDNRNAQILTQLWDILLLALDQLKDMLGNTRWEPEAFLRLFRLLLSQYDVGTIPPVLDTVTVGGISAMRCQQVKHLIILGASEGTFPPYGSASGILSDSERTSLRNLGVPLTGGAAEGLQIAFSEIYGVFCGATDSIYVSCPGDKTSFLYRRLLEMVGKHHEPADVIGAAAVNCNEAAAMLVRYQNREAAAFLGLDGRYQDILIRSQYELGNISPDNIKTLYGSKLNLSASQVDKLADCRLSYYLKYGLRVKECKPVTVDPAEFGTYVHAVLENTASKIKELGGFKAVTLQETLDIADAYAKTYAAERFSQLDSQRIAYLFQRNSRELMMVVEELWKEMQETSFDPAAFELAFGENEALGAIDIPATIPAQLRGFVDRVDIWNHDGCHYFRVIDYKTGKKDFDYCDILNGLGLQMLLYLFTLADSGSSILGNNPIPAGVQYFPARAPILNADSELSDEQAEAKRKTEWKRKGLILKDEDVIYAMERVDPPARLSCKKLKDGTITGDVATTEQLRVLKRFVFHLLGKMVDEIASGVVAPNPYTRGNNHNACRYCPYGSVCHSATVEGRRNYKTVTATKFWEDVHQEVSKLE